MPCVIVIQINAFNGCCLRNIDTLDSKIAAVFRNAIDADTALLSRNDSSCILRVNIQAGRFIGSNCGADSDIVQCGVRCDCRRCHPNIFIFCNICKCDLDGFVVGLLKVHTVTVDQNRCNIIAVIRLNARHRSSVIVNFCILNCNRSVLIACSSDGIVNQCKSDFDVVILFYRQCLFPRIIGSISVILKGLFFIVDFYFCHTIMFLWCCCDIKPCAGGHHNRTSGSGRIGGNSTGSIIICNTDRVFLRKYGTDVDIRIRSDCCRKGVQVRERLRCIVNGNRNNLITVCCFNLNRHSAILIYGNRAVAFIIDKNGSALTGR